jgi:hypothetical protein
MMPLRSAVFVLGLGFAIASAFAQRADAPDVRAGDEWQFVAYQTVRPSAPNRVWTIVSVGEASIDATENGEPLRLTRELNVVESPRGRYSDARALAFPLAVGKTWRYRNEWLFKPKSSRGYALVRVTVEAFEPVSVEAGVFDAFRLVARGTLHGVSPVGSRYDAETTSTYWYAPAARAVVKSIDHNPYLGTTTVELVASSRRH